jgi:hypothetical protein
MREEDWEGVMALDRRAVRVDREKLLRHLMGEVRVRAWVKQEGSVLRGHATARPGRLAWCMGPVVGEDDEVSVELMERVMADMEEAGAGSVLVDVPRGRLKPWLTGRGFVIKRELVRMGTHHDDRVMHSPLVAAIGALELG